MWNIKDSFDIRMVLKVGDLLAAGVGDDDIDDSRLISI